MLSILGESFTPAAVTLKYPLLSRENFLHLETSEFFFSDKFGQGKFENSISRDGGHFMTLPELVSSVWKMNDGSRT